MDLRINRCRKYVTWNIISVLGYLGFILSLVFLVMMVISSSNIGVSADITKIFYEYTVKNVILPYIEVYKTQLIITGIMLIASVYENSYYMQRGEYGLRLFPDNEKIYSIIFVTGLCLNLLPMYMFFVFILSKILQYFVSL